MKSKKKAQVKNTETVQSYVILESLQSNYKQLSKTLPGDIDTLEKQIKKEDEEHETRLADKRKQLDHLKQALKDLPQAWSLDTGKTISEKATNMMGIGQKIKELRDKKKWSQKTLGAKIKKRQSDISRIELGKSAPSEKMLTSLAGVFEVPKDSLTNGFHSHN